MYTVMRFNYTGKVQSVTLLPGRYQLECFGARGGNMITSPWNGQGGSGGYAKGTITLKRETTLYIYCGCDGQDYVDDGPTTWGWNGGSLRNSGAAGGGGATDISLSGTKDSTTWHYYNHYHSRIIVAGGGGGANDYQQGGFGGGLFGQFGENGCYGGTQTGCSLGDLVGGFGYGASDAIDGGQCGGGWYGGTKAYGCFSAGSGGSGYVYTQETASYYPTPYLINEDYYLTNTSMTGVSNRGKGYAIMTVLENPDMYNFYYTGKTQAVTLNTGVYEFYCRGAQGGNNGLYGSISLAKIVITKPTTFYVNIGGTTANTIGGWNGGGNSANEAYGGGGSTDVAVQGTNGSTAWNNTQHLNSRIIMAAGGTGKDKPSVSTPGSTTGTASATRADGRSTYTNRFGGYVMEIIPTVSGQIYFQSTNYSHDPYGFIDDDTGINLISNDDLGRPITGNTWDFMMKLSVVANKKYVLRIGSYQSNLGTTGWCTWYATYPNSLVKIYAVMTTQPVPGGTGGSLNYVYTKGSTYPITPCNCDDNYMYDPLIYANHAEAVGNGYAYIYKIGDIVKKPTLAGEYYYTGSNQTAVVNDFNNTAMTIANNVKTTAGSYIISITLKQNYCWLDGTRNVISLTWVINKINPIITWPIPTSIGINALLSTSVLKNGIGNGKFYWSNPTIKVDYPNKGYEVTFTPLDTTNYNTVKSILLLQVFTKTNSNFYKDSNTQELFDFNKL